jgi:hypothetical protein
MEDGPSSTGVVALSTVTGTETFDVHPVEVKVNLNVAVPGDIPVTAPEWLTTATSGFIDAHVPPVVGERFVVPPIQIAWVPVTSTTGLGNTVSASGNTASHPVLLWINLNPVIPALIPVTKPVFVTDATEGCKETQIPPVEGLNCVVCSIQISPEPAIIISGDVLTVSKADESEAQPVPEWVKINFVVPDEMAVTKPSFVTVAEAGLEDIHVPPFEGLSCVVAPIHSVPGPDMLIFGFSFIVTPAPGSDWQPEVDVNINLVVPPESPVTSPVLLTDAIPGNSLVQVPPLAGISWVVWPGQIVAGPTILIIGFERTVTLPPGSEVHPDPCSVNVKDAFPAAIALTSPVPETVATEVLEDVHVPPVEGVSWAALPTQTVLFVMLIVGLEYTVNAGLGRDTQPVVVFVKIKFAVPGAKPVTIPELVTEAIAGLDEVHVPPVAGRRFDTPPIQISVGPETDTIGLAFTVTGAVGNDGQPPAKSKNVNVAVPLLIPVTMPWLFTDAMAGLLLTHIPPDDGESVVWFPAQIISDPATETEVGGFTVITTEVSEIHPEKVLVKINLDVPLEIPVINPAFEIVATPGWVLVHVPPVVGNIWVVEPGQIWFGPSSRTAGLSYTINDKSLPVIQPAEFVNRSEATPGETDVTVPFVETVAMWGCREVHDPPE